MNQIHNIGHMGTARVVTIDIGAIDRETKRHALEALAARFDEDEKSCDTYVRESGERGEASRETESCAATWRDDARMTREEIAKL